VEHIRGHLSHIYSITVNQLEPSHGGNSKFFEVITSTLPKGTLGSVASLLAATLYQGNIYPLAKLGKCNTNLASTILKQLAKMAR
jgi:hypothetical protein